jgi:hypothetical protein
MLLFNSVINIAMTTELKTNDYNNEVRTIFNLLSVKGKYHVIGSGKLAEIHYKSDYDLEERISETNKDYTSVLLSLFQKKYKKAEADENIFITDFKCGEIDGKPVRWNKETIKTGKQVIKGKSFSFTDCVMMKSVMKMDIIALINGVFTEFSENYYIKIGTKTNYSQKKQSKTNQLYSIRFDVFDYFKAGDIFKSLKRLFAFFKLKGGNSKDMKKLIEFFNGQVGYLNKSKNALQVLLSVLENDFRKPQMSDVSKNLQIVKQDLAGVTEIDLKTTISETIDLLSKTKKKSDLIEGIRLLDNYLTRKINESSETDFLEKNVLLYNYIK